MNSIQSSWQIGSLRLSHRLIQGPLAGFSCAPFRRLFRHFHQPAYAVSEMISAQDILTKHKMQSRYLYRAEDEGLLAYQISGHNPAIMASAAAKLQDLGADLIDINCGCPKAKIRQKGAGSALLEQPQHLLRIVAAVRAVLTIPLTVKIRINQLDSDRLLVQQLAAAGADALIIHGRHWTHDYDIPNHFEHLGALKQAVSIPVIANGDIADRESLARAQTLSACDGYMIARAGTGKPWLFQSLLTENSSAPALAMRINYFIEHITALAQLENDHLALLQSRSLFRYYFPDLLTKVNLSTIYSLTSLVSIEKKLYDVTIAG